MSAAVAVPERVRTILDMLTAAAERADDCPSSNFLATGAGCARDAAIDAVKLLEAMNLIRVERGRNWRVVTIVATGKSTKRPQRMVLGATRESAAEARSANRRKRIGLFCDALSCGTPDAPVTIKQAGIVAGVSEPTAISFMKEVRADLGWQAQ